MITVGEEGFYTKGSSGEAVNPGTGWASLTGQDFIANHASPAIDFAAAHIWPDNWEVRGHLLDPFQSTSFCCTCACTVIFVHSKAFRGLFSLPWTVECCMCLSVVDFQQTLSLLNPATQPCPLHHSALAKRGVKHVVLMFWAKCRLGMWIFWRDGSSSMQQMPKLWGSPS